MTAVSTKLASLNALSASTSNSITKSAIKSDLEFVQAQTSKVSSFVEDMEFDDLDAVVSRGLALTIDTVGALNGKGDESKKAAQTLQNNGKQVGAAAEKLIVAGQKISEDPDDEESTNTFVELSESFPSMFQSLIDEINTIVSGSLLDSVDIGDDLAARSEQLLKKREAEKKAQEQQAKEKAAADKAAADKAAADKAAADKAAADKAAADKAAAEKERNRRILEEKKAASASVVSSATPALQAESGLSAAEKAEEERLMRAMQRKAGARVASKPKTTASPVVSKPTPSPAKSGGVPAWKQKQLDEEKAREQQLKREQEELAKRQAAIQSNTDSTSASPAPTPKPATNDDIPLWKKQRMQREKEAEEKRKRDAEVKARAMSGIAANAAQRERAQMSAESSPVWEPPKKKEESLGELAGKLGAPDARKLDEKPVAASSKPTNTRMDAVKCGSCNIMIVGGYKNALGKAWHHECWKCAECQQKLAAKFANMAGQPYCVPCAKARIAKAKAARS